MLAKVSITCMLKFTGNIYVSAVQVRKNESLVCETPISFGRGGQIGNKFRNCEIIEINYMLY